MNKTIEKDEMREEYDFSKGIRGKHFATYQQGTNVIFLEQEVEMSLLREEFSADIKSAIGQCYALGYAPTRFEQMIKTKHPVEVAKKLVVSVELQYGFKELNKMGKPELTVEGIMLQDKYNALFTPNELRAAQWRLNHVEKTAL